MKSSPVEFLMMYEVEWFVKQFSFIAGRMTFSLPEASWRSLDVITVQRTEAQKRIQSARKHSGVAYFDCGIQTLRLAWTFLMVPLGLNQLCLLFAWVPMLLLLTRFHCLEMKSARILRNRNEERINEATA